MKDITVEFTAIYWECGDGCCSRFHHEIEAYENGICIGSRDEYHYVGYDASEGDPILMEAARDFVEGLMDDDEEFIVTIS